MPASRFTDIRHFDTIDSTNRYLLDAGPGRCPRGRRWRWPSTRVRAGGGWGDGGKPPRAPICCCPCCCAPASPPIHRHLASAVVALAAAEAAESVAGVRLGVKWPNDLLGPDGRKVAGVLAEGDVAAPLPGPGGGDARPAVERGPGGGGEAAIVVGIGINVNWPAADADLPDDLVGVATSLRQLAGRAVDRAEMLSALLTALEPRLADLGTVSGRTRQADDLRSRCTTIGSPVRIELLASGFEGTAVDVTDQGHLVVEVDGTRRIVVAGDVVHVRPPA